MASLGLLQHFCGFGQFREEISVLLGGFLDRFGVPSFLDLSLFQLFLELLGFLGRKLQFELKIVELGGVFFFEILDFTCEGLLGCCEFLSNLVDLRLDFRLISEQTLVFRGQRLELSLGFLKKILVEV